jgi:hypothetical protein
LRVRQCMVHVQLHGTDSMGCSVRGTFVCGIFETVRTVGDQMSDVRCQKVGQLRTKVERERSSVFFFVREVRL